MDSGFFCTVFGIEGSELRMVLSTLFCVHVFFLGDYKVNIVDPYMPVQALQEDLSGSLLSPG